jgi:hypothetical protein
MKSTPFISHRLIAAAISQDDGASSKPVRNPKPDVRLPDIATAIPLELMAAGAPPTTARPVTIAPNSPGIAL